MSISVVGPVGDNLVSTSAQASPASVWHAGVKAALDERVGASPAAVSDQPVPDGGIWGLPLSAALNAKVAPVLDPGGSASLTNTYVAELKAGKTVQQIQDSAHPTQEQAQSLNNALETLGISNRQVGVYAAALQADTAKPGPPSADQRQINDRLIAAMRARVGIDGDSGPELRGFNANPFTAPPVNPQIGSIQGAIAAFREGEAAPGTTASTTGLDASALLYLPQSFHNPASGAVAVFYTDAPTLTIPGANAALSNADIATAGAQGRRILAETDSLDGLPAAQAGSGQTSVGAGGSADHSAATALQQAYLSLDVPDSGRISGELLATIAGAALHGNVQTFMPALNDVQAKSFQEAAQAFVTENGIKVAPGQAEQVFGTALAWDIGLGHSSASVSDKWTEYSRPGDAKFTAYFSVARQIYADKYGEAAALKLDAPHYDTSLTTTGDGQVVQVKKLDGDYQYRVLAQTFNTAVADYKPTYDPTGRLITADPVSRMTQFIQGWSFTYGDKQTPTLTHPDTGLSDVQSRAAFAKLGDTAARYDRYMDLGSANPAAINILEGIFTLGIANLVQDSISKARSNPVNDWIAGQLQGQGRDPFEAATAKSAATSRLVFDGALIALNVVGPLAEAAGPLARLTEVGATLADGGTVAREALASATAQGVLDQAPPVTAAEVSAGRAVQLTGNGDLSFTATSVARPGAEDAIYAPVANITGPATKELVHLIPTDVGRTEWAAVDEAGNLLGRVNVTADGSLDLSAGSHAMLGRSAGSVTLLRQVAGAVDGLPQVTRSVGDVITSSSSLEPDLLTPVVSQRLAPWEAPALTRGFAASAITDTGAAARAQVVQVLDGIGTAKPTLAQGRQLEDALQEFTDQEFTQDLDLRTTGVPNDFSAGDRAKMLDTLLSSGAMSVNGMDESMTKFFGVLRPGEGTVLPAFQATQTLSIKTVTAALEKSGLLMPQSEFAKLAPAAKESWINKVYDVVGSALGLVQKPGLRLVEGDPATMGNTLYVKDSQGYVSTALSKIDINMNGVFRGKQGFDDIGTLVNVMTHELTHARQYELINGVDQGLPLASELRQQGQLLAVSDKYSQINGLGSLDPNYKLSAHEAQAFDIGDSVEAAIQPFINPPSS